MSAVREESTRAQIHPRESVLFPVLAPKAPENSFCWPCIVLFSAEMLMVSYQMYLCVEEGGSVASLSLMPPAQVYRGGTEPCPQLTRFGDASHMASKITAGNTRPRRVNRGHWICCNSEMLLEDKEILWYSFRSWIYCLKLKQQPKKKTLKVYGTQWVIQGEEHLVTWDDPDLEHRGSHATKTFILNGILSK